MENLYLNGIEEASNTQILIENVLIIGLITSGAVLTSLFQVQNIPVISVGYILFAVIMLGVVLRKHLCTACWYYGKKCHCGWGKLAEKLFKQNSGNKKIGAIGGNLTWGLIMIFPLLTFITYAVSNQTVRANWIGLGIFLGFVIINGVLHKKSCTNCKMRVICPGSAAKKVNC